MYTDILFQNQKELLPVIKLFSNEYYLAGGTAIALNLGHRKSVDFDLFTPDVVKRKSIKTILGNSGFTIGDILFEDQEQMHILVNSMKMTFFSFPYSVIAEVKLKDIIKMPNLLDLAAMKAYALGGRAKWKDYVDLYFLVKNKFSLNQISDKAKEIFGSFFTKKLFKEQLSYFEDIDYSEEIQFVGEPLPEDTIKKFLVQAATEEF